MEAASRFELEIKALQASALPLGEAAVYAIFFVWSGRRDLNPRLQPWQGCTLPLSYSRIYETARRKNTLEAASRFELEMEVLQTSALPLGYAASKTIGAGDGI